MLLLQPGGLLEHARGHIDTGGDRTLLGQPAGALPGTAADFEHLLTVDIAEQLDVGFVNSLRTPDELSGTEEAAVLGEILLSRMVPIAAIGPD